MNTFRKYEKTYRIELPYYKIKGKYHLAKKQENLLLRGNCTVTEKFDGGNTGIYKVNDKCYLQKRRANVDYSHPQYSFFQNEWYWNNKKKLDKLSNDIVVYGELLRCVHSIYYNSLPDWFIVFDIYDLKKEKYLSYSQMKGMCNKVGLCCVPLLYEGQIPDKNFLLNLIPSKSAYGDVAEGVVVKNYRQQVRGKVVKKEFLKFIEDENTHWVNRKIKLNTVKESGK